MAKTLVAKRPYKEHDWEELLTRFENESRLAKVLLKDFALREKVNYSLISQEFVKLRKERAAKYYETAQYKFAEGSIKAADKMVSLIESADENVALKASEKVAGIAGHSPAVAQVNVTQTNQMAVVMPPMFGAAPDGLKALLGGQDE